MRESFAGLSQEGSTAAPDTPVSSDFSVASCGGSVNVAARRGCYGGTLRGDQAHVARAARVDCPAVSFEDQADLAEAADKGRGAKHDSVDRWLGGVSRTSLRGRLGGAPAFGATTPPVPVDQPVRGGPRSTSGPVATEDSAGTGVGRGRQGSPKPAPTNPRGGTSAWARNSARNLHPDARRSAGSPGRGRIVQRVASPSPATSPARGTSPGRSLAASAAAPRVGAPFSLREQLESMGQQKVLLEWQVEEATRNQQALELTLSEERMRSAADREKLSMLVARIEQLEHGGGARGASAAVAAAPEPEQHTQPGVRQGSPSPDTKLRHENERLRRDLELSREMLARYTEELSCIMPGVQRMLAEAKHSRDPAATSPVSLGQRLPSPVAVSDEVNLADSPLSYQRFARSATPPPSTQATAVVPQPQASRATLGASAKTAGQAGAGRRTSSPSAPSASRAAAAGATTRRTSPGASVRQGMQAAAGGSLSSGAGARPAATKPGQPGRASPQGLAASKWGSRSATSLGTGSSVASRGSGRFA